MIFFINISFDILNEENIENMLQYFHYCVKLSVNSEDLELYSFLYIP